MKQIETATLHRGVAGARHTFLPLPPTANKLDLLLQVCWALLLMKRLVDGSSINQLMCWQSMGCRGDGADCSSTCAVRPGGSCAGLLADS